MVFRLGEYFTATLFTVSLLSYTLSQFTEMFVPKILLSVNSISANEELTGCSELVQKFKPRDCCDYPSVFLPPSIGKECSTRCLNETATSSCFLECVEEKTHLMVDGKIILDSLLAIFEAENPQQSRDIWTPVFEKSIEICEKIGKISF
jgi:hypothetical protein